MRVVLGSDDKTPLTDAVIADLEARGARVELIGPPAGVELEWADVGREVGAAVGSGRAALCTDAATAEGTRRWNDANVLVMSLRLTTPEVAHEMLDAWFATDADPGEAENIARLDAGR